MAIEYRLIFLSPGQMVPEGCVGAAVDNGIVWIGEDGTFPLVATLGKHLDTDSDFETSYSNRLMTQDEIYTYYNNPVEPDEE